MKPSTRLYQLAGLGDVAAAQASASALVSFLQANGCTQASVPQVTQFQTDYNSSGLPGTLTVDGQYGGNTQAALQAVLGSSQTAPANCFGMAVPSTPAPDTGTTNPDGSTTPDTSGGGPDYTPWIIGSAAILGVGILGAAYWRRKHRGRR